MKVWTVRNPRTVSSVPEAGRPGSEQLGAVQLDEACPDIRNAGSRAHPVSAPRQLKGRFPAAPCVGTARASVGKIRECGRNMGRKDGQRVCAAWCEGAIVAMSGKNVFSLLSSLVTCLKSVRRAGYKYRSDHYIISVPPGTVSLLTVLGTSAHSLPHSNDRHNGAHGHPIAAAQEPPDAASDRPAAAHVAGADHRRPCAGIRASPFAGRREIVTRIQASGTQQCSPSKGAKGTVSTTPHACAPDRRDTPRQARRRCRRRHLALASRPDTGTVIHRSAPARGDRPAP